MTDFSDLISKAKDLQDKFKETQETLKKIHLDQMLLKESKEIVEDLIVAAHNDAKSKLKKKTSEEISKVTGGINLPPGFKIPF